MARVAAVSRAVSAGVIAAVALVAPASTTVAATMNLYMNTSRVESLQPDCHGCTIVRTDGLRACEKVESLVVSGFPPPLRQFYSELRRDLAEARRLAAGLDRVRMKADAPEAFSHGLMVAALPLITLSSPAPLP